MAETSLNSVFQSSPQSDGESGTSSIAAAVMDADRVQVQEEAPGPDVEPACMAETSMYTMRSLEDEMLGRGRAWLGELFCQPQFARHLAVTSEMDTNERSCPQSTIMNGVPQDSKPLGREMGWRWQIYNDIDVISTFQFMFLP